MTFWPGVRQPEHLGLDKFHILDEKAAKKWQPDVREDSIFLKIERKGSLNFWPGLSATACIIHLVGHVPFHPSPL